MRRGQKLREDSSPPRWSSGSGALEPAEAETTHDEEPTFRELATDWLQARKQNPAIGPRTTELNEWQLRRYLAPFFGELLPSQITNEKVKQYRRHPMPRMHASEQPRKPERPLRIRGQARLSGRCRTNRSTRRYGPWPRSSTRPRTQAGDPNVARGRRTREPLERRRPRRILEVDEFLSLLEAAARLDRERHRPATLARAAEVRLLRDDAGGVDGDRQANWRRKVDRVLPIRLQPRTAGPIWGARRPVMATLALAGPRVSELCQLNVDDIDLTKARFYIEDAKTLAGIRDVDIHPRLLDELTAYAANRPPSAGDAPAFPTRNGTDGTRTTSAYVSSRQRWLELTNFEPRRTDHRSARTSPHTRSGAPTSPT